MKLWLINRSSRDLFVKELIPFDIINQLIEKFGEWIKIDDIELRIERRISKKSPKGDLRIVLKKEYRKDAKKDFLQSEWISNAKVVTGLKLRVKSGEKYSINTIKVDKPSLIDTINDFKERAIQLTSVTGLERWRLCEILRFDIHVSNVLNVIDSAQKYINDTYTKRFYEKNRRGKGFFTVYYKGTYMTIDNNGYSQTDVEYFEDSSAFSLKEAFGTHLKDSSGNYRYDDRGNPIYDGLNGKLIAKFTKIEGSVDYLIDFSRFCVIYHEL